MKIAHVSATFPPYMAGTGNVCYHNAVELAKLGHDVTVFTSRYPDEDYTYPDSITVKRYKPWFRIGNAPFLPQLLGLREFDIIHLHYPFFFGAEMIYLLSKLTKQKYVISYHNDVMLSGIINPFLSIYKSTCMRLIVKNSRKICTSSLDFGVNSELTSVMDVSNGCFAEVPIGVDADRFNPSIDTIAIKSRHNLLGKRVILFVGALDKAHYFKGLEYLLDSFAGLNIDETILLIIGDGDLKDYYQGLSLKMGVLDRVIFLGKVQNEELPKYYATADLLVLPSIKIESFGLVLLEAMACGKPVIASNLPGVRTVVDDGLNGFLVEPKDCCDLITKMRYLLEEDGVKESFGRAGRKKVEEKYSWGKIGEELERLYLGLIG